jgi:hypothetical protein
MQGQGKAVENALPVFLARSQLSVRSLTADAGHKNWYDCQPITQLMDY